MEPSIGMEEYISSNKLTCYCCLLAQNLQAEEGHNFSEKNDRLTGVKCIKL